MLLSNVPQRVDSNLASLWSRMVLVPHDYSKSELSSFTEDLTPDLSSKIFSLFLDCYHFLSSKNAQSFKRCALELRSIGCANLYNVIITSSYVWKPSSSNLKQLVAFNLSSLSSNGLFFLSKLSFKLSPSIDIDYYPLHALYLLDFRNNPFNIPRDVLFDLLTSSYKVVLHRIICHEGVLKCMEYLNQALLHVDHKTSLRILEHFLRLVYTDKSSHRYLKQIKETFSDYSAELLNTSNIVRLCSCVHSYKDSEYISPLKLNNGTWQNAFHSVMSSKTTNELYDAVFSLSPSSPKRSSSSSKPTVEFFYLIWGDKFYFESLSEFGLSSLFTSTDFSLIREKYFVRFYIYTLPEHSDSVLEIHKRFDDIDEIIVNTEILSSSKSPLDMRGFCYLDAYCAAEKLGFKSFQFGPDLIFGNGISKLLDNCPIGGSSAAGLIRHSRAAAVAASTSRQLSKIYDSPNRNSLLASLALDDWSIPFQSYYYEPTNPDLYHQVCQKTNFTLPQVTSPTFVLSPSPGLILESLQYVSYRYNNILPDSFMQLFDHDVPRLLESRGLRHVPDSYLDFICCEPSTDGGYFPNEKVLFLNPFRNQSLIPSLQHSSHLSWLVAHG